MSNASVQALRKALAEQSARTTAGAHDGVELAAQELAAAIRGRARIHSGNTAESVEAVQIGPGKWRVQAGGRLTTREIRNGSGKSYDYTRAEEFGTQEQGAHPFFYNTCRAKKNAIVKDVESKVAAAQI